MTKTVTPKKVVRIDAPADTLLLQYDLVKLQYPEPLCMIRVGDFFEAFGKDAEKLAQLTDLKLTRVRVAGSTEMRAMTGMPAVLVQSYVEKLLAQQCKCCLIEQVAGEKALDVGYIGDMDYA